MAEHPRYGEVTPERLEAAFKREDELQLRLDRANDLGRELYEALKEIESEATFSVVKDALARYEREVGEPRQAVDVGELVRDFEENPPPPIDRSDEVRSRRAR